ncbi:hypothetical protein [Phormidium sp. CCY1219]|nr:hypothetical protein [Phormidium sp. CCY1219]
MGEEYARAPERDTDRRDRGGVIRAIARSGDRVVHHPSKFTKLD